MLITSVRCAMHKAAARSRHASHFRCLAEPATNFLSGFKPLAAIKYVSHCNIIMRGGGEDILQLTLWQVQWKCQLQGPHELGVSAISNNCRFDLIICELLLH